MLSPDETTDPREDDKFRLLRAAMVNHQLRERDIDDGRVLRAMDKVPRHLFVPVESCWRAYEDCPLPIGYDQTISQPYIVAKMLDALELDGHERVLDVGTGSGYQAAVLAELAREVWSVEIIPELARAARSRLHELGYSNVQVITGDGSVGLSERAPFDAIVVAAASPGVPPSLLEQLSPSGRLVLPVGDRDFQVLRRVTHPGNRPTIDSLLPCAFVPLVGEEGSALHPVTAWKPRMHN
jgi:protein-L-isoaspartate(D-aspartate) O-methyltransferase